MEQVRKTAKYYRDILNGNDIRKALSVIPDIINKFGFVDKYRSEIKFGWDTMKENFNWNHAIEGFFLGKDGKLYAHIYWQGDSTDGTDSVLASYLIGGYTIKAEWDNIGGNWGMECRPSPLEVTEDELRKAIKAIVPLLSADLIKARKKVRENEPYVMPMYGRINKWLEREHPYNRYGWDTYKEKYRNSENAIRALMIPDAKKFMQMPEVECHKVLNRVYEQNNKVDGDIPTNDKGEKVYNLSY